MDLAPGALQATVAAYNDGAACAVDPLLHKKAQWLKPIGSPVGAIDPRESTGGFTLGGHVLHVSGEPIPGLYAPGRSAARLAAWGSTPVGCLWATAASTAGGLGVAQLTPDATTRPDAGRRHPLSEFAI